MEMPRQEGVRLMETRAAEHDERTALAQEVRSTLARSANCAQTSFAVLQRRFDLDGETILKALTPFPGLALRGETCGAVTGCLMAIGLVYGRDRLEDWKGYIASLPPSRKFCRRFVEAHGSTSCGDLLQAKLGRRFNLADRGESLEYVALGGPQACSEIITRAVGMAAEIIRRERAEAELQPSRPQQRVALQPAFRVLLARAYLRVAHLRRRLRS